MSTMLRSGTAEEAGIDPVRLARVRELCRGWVANGDTPSLQVLVARRGVVVMHEAFGVRCHTDTEATLRLDSIFPLASCTKPVTAATVMCLVEDGLVGLNRPFVDYVPELDVADVEWLTEATVGDLLRHTAGIDDIDLGTASATTWKMRRPELPPPAPGQYPFLNRVIRLAAGLPLARRPGTALLYSNFGYNLLGDIVRRVTGQPFWQFVQHRVFDPLGMRDSSLVLPPEHRERRVYRAPGLPATLRSGSWPGIDSSEYDEADWGGMGMASTAWDLAVFAQMLLQDGRYGDQRVLSRASVSTMTRDQIAPSIPRIVPWVNEASGLRSDLEVGGGGYGYGVYVNAPGDRFIENGSLMSTTAYGHVGNGGACWWADPEQDLVGVYLSVMARLHRGVGATNSDQFQNTVHSAIMD